MLHAWTRRECLGERRRPARACVGVPGARNRRERSLSTDNLRSARPTEETTEDAKLGLIFLNVTSDRALRATK